MVFPLIYSTVNFDEIVVSIKVFFVSTYPPGLLLKYLKTFMKVICTQENLKAGLVIVGRIISSSNTLPILNNLLLKTENGTLKISSTNLEIAIITNTRCKTEEEGAVTVISKTFSDLINSLPNQNIILEGKENELFIETDNHHNKIKTLPPEEFPIIPSVENGTTLVLNSQDLKQAVDQVFFAASTNQTQPEISGVLFAWDDKGLRIVATDRYRLAEKKMVLAQKPPSSQEVIVPQRTIAELSRIIGNQKGNVEMVFSQNQCSINFNETQIISRLVDGQYPDYQQIIPTSFSTNLATEKTSLINALRTVSVFSQNNNSVKAQILPVKQQLVLTAESSDLGKSQVELAAKAEGGEVSLILNYHYLLDALSSIDSKNVIIKTIDDSSPCLLVPEETNDYTYLVMPIKS